MLHAAAWCVNSCRSQRRSRRSSTERQQRRGRATAAPAQSQASGGLSHPRWRGGPAGASVVPSTPGPLARLDFCARVRMSHVGRWVHTERDRLQRLVQPTLRSTPSMPSRNTALHLPFFGVPHSPTAPQQRTAPRRGCFVSVCTAGRMYGRYKQTPKPRCLLVVYGRH